MSVKPCDLVIIQSNRDSHSSEVTAVMSWFRISVFAIVALAMGGALLTLSGCGGGPGGGSTKPAPPTIVKIFGAATIPLNGTTTLTFTLSNPNAGTTLTGVGFTDSLPAGLVVSTPNGLTGGCGGGTITATAGSGSVSLTGASLAASASCNFSVNVTGISAGTQNNTTSAVTSNEGNGNSASASITVVGPPTIGKTFGAATIALNATTTLSFNVSNSNAGATLTGVGFADSLPAGLVVSTPNGLTGSCGGGTITAAAGSGSVSLTGASLAASASCSFWVNVTGTTEGAKNNTTSAVTSNEGGNGNSASASVTVGASPAKIQHVVLIVQENRSTDNMFQDPVLIRRGAAIAQSGQDSNGNTIQLQELDIAAGFNPAHGHHAFDLMCDLNSVTGQCQMDGANLIPVTCPQGIQNCVYSYVNPSEVQPYFQMAETYTFADHMFQTNQGPSMPAHQFLISGTSAPSTGSDLFAAENPATDGPPNAGCDASAGSTVALIDPTGNENSYTPIYPCFEHQTLTDLLEANGNTWRYYTSSGYRGGGGQAIWIGPESIEHMCGPNAPPPNATACVGSDWINDVILNQAQILTDITNNQLPDVSWVIPTGQASDHPGLTDGSGPSWVASVVNQIGNSPYWANTAIFITWDDWGGLYDHVPPPQVLVNCTPAQWGCGYVYGFRVPLIVVSPYAKAQYVSTQQYDFGSLLRFIEETFNLGSLNYADAAAVNDFSDCFDFNQTPLPFQTIQAPLKAEYFLNDKTPPLDPDDD